MLFDEEQDVAFVFGHEIAVLDDKGVSHQHDQAAVFRVADGVEGLGGRLDLVDRGQRSGQLGSGAVVR